MVKSSIPNIVLAGWLGSLTATSSLARAAEPEAAPFGGTAAPVAPQRSPVTVEQAPGVDLPPQIAADLGAAFEDALVGRAPPGVSIDITPIAGRFRGLLVGGLDYFGRRTELSRGGFDTVYSTPQVAAYLGMVVEAVLRP
jgi:hypothetical protein